MRRRTVLRGMGLLGLAALSGLPVRRRALAGPACVLSPAQTAGPFYFDADLLRRDITEGRDGVPLALRLRVVDARSCLALEGAVVDVWHADAAGLYSGYPNQGDERIDTSGATFMRGLQVSDEYGMVEFATVYPGWYPGRVEHIHFKVHLDDRTYVTSQLYFPAATTAQVATLPPYDRRGANPTTLQTDGVLRPGQLDALLMDVAAEGDGYAATHSLGIDLPAAAPTPTPVSTPEACVGDCSGDGKVAIDELIRGVRIALGRADGGTCPTFDRDGDGAVAVADLVAAVRSALRGCR